MPTTVEIEWGVIISAVTATIALLAFILSTKKERHERRSERDADVSHRALVDASLSRIEESCREMRNDIKEIKETSAKHDGRITILETDLKQLHANVQNLAKEFREFKHEATKKLPKGGKQ